MHSTTHMGPKVQGAALHLPTYHELKDYWLAVYMQVAEKGRQGASISKGSQLVCIWCCQTAVLVSSLIINTTNGEKALEGKDCTAACLMHTELKFLDVLPTYTDLCIILTDLLASMTQILHLYYEHHGQLNFMKLSNLHLGFTFLKRGI